MNISSVAVIGAGISGTIAAQTLRQKVASVTLFDKSRGLGGRTATRRADPGLSFDHGAQYFTARDKQFQRHVEDWLAQGIVAEWSGTIVEIDTPAVRTKIDQPQRFVGIPGMTAIARHLAADLPLQLETKITRAAYDGGSWMLADESHRVYGPFDGLIVSLPAPQSAELLNDHSLAAEIKTVPMTPCWTVLAAFETAVPVSWQGAFIHHSPLGWVAHNSSKPSRDASRHCWVLQATADWSTANRDAPRSEIPAMLLADFSRVLGTPLPATHYLEAHRWMYSATSVELDKLVLQAPQERLVVCGDWLAGGRVEGAFRSGLAAASGLLQATGNSA